MITIGKLVVVFNVVGAPQAAVATQSKALPGGPEGLQFVQLSPLGNRVAAFADEIIQRKAISPRGDAQLELGSKALELPAERNEAAVARAISLGQPIENLAQPGTARGVIQASGDASGSISSLPGGTGESIAPAVREKMETAFDTDFSKVRVHTDSDSHSMAAGLNAHAFTTGRDIYFGRGEYNPGTARGMALLAHELTHVVQQGDSIKRKALPGIGADMLALDTMWRVDGQTGMLQKLAAVPSQESPSPSQDARERRIAQRAVTRSPGLPLLQDERARQEQTHGTDLGNVRIHQDSTSQAASKDVNAQAFQTGDHVVLTSQSAAKGQGGEQPTVQHEVTHAAQENSGQTEQARSNPFARFMLEQAARLVEHMAPEQAQRFKIGEMLRSPQAASGLSSLLERALGSVLNPPGESTPGQAENAGQAGQAEDPSQAGKGEQEGNEQPGKGGTTPPRPKEGEEEGKGGDNYIHQIMRYYGVRPHIGEEEFLEELTERVIELMDEEYLIENERKSLTQAPF